MNPYDKLDFEMPYPELASGGFYFMYEYPNIQHNLKALEDVWDYSYDQRCLIMALIRQLMNVTNVVSQENLIAQVKALFVRKCGNHDSAKSP